MPSFLQGWLIFRKSNASGSMHVFALDETTEEIVREVLAAMAVDQERLVVHSHLPPGVIGNPPAPTRVKPCRGCATEKPEYVPIPRAAR